MWVEEREAKKYTVLFLRVRRRGCWNESGKVGEIRGAKKKARKAEATDR
jgi:hypothetical protein